MSARSAEQAPTDQELRLFDGGPPLRVLRLWGRFDPDHQHVLRRALIVVGVGWLPLLLLALLSLTAGRDDVWLAFLRDASVHARSLLVAPLLVLAEAVCIPRLGELAHTFRERELLPASALPGYERVVRSIQWLRDWWLIEALALVLAYAMAILIVQTVPASYLPNWHQAAGSAPMGRSLASWWHALVSLPLLLILMLGWCWRVLLWALFLWRVSRLDLQLVAAHPEGAAGLMFLSHSLSSFALLGAAIGIIVAATELGHLLAGGTIAPELLGRVALGTVAFALVVFVAPLLSFCTPLLRTWRHDVQAYGALAQRVGVSLEDRWMRAPPSPETADPLSSPDFSAVTDLFQTVEKAYGLRMVPVELRSLLPLAVATALPFGVVALTLVPFDKVLEKVLGMFL